MELDKETKEAKIVISNDDLEDAFNKTETNEDGKKKVKLEITETEGVKSYQADLPKSVLESDKEKEIEIKTDIGTVTLPGNMFDNEESGDGNNKFNPKTHITREDMMVLTERALRLKGLLNEITDNSTLDDYTDKTQIAAYAIDSVSSLISYEIIQGSNNMINPKGNTTRVEATVVLYKIYSIRW